jgi:hypothetical protein
MSLEKLRNMPARMRWRWNLYNTSNGFKVRNDAEGYIKTKQDKQG